VCWLGWGVCWEPLWLIAVVSETRQWLCWPCVVEELQFISWKQHVGVCKTLAVAAPDAGARVQKYAASSSVSKVFLRHGNSCAFPVGKQIVLRLVVCCWGRLLGVFMGPQCLCGAAATAFPWVVGSTVKILFGRGSESIWSQFARLLTILPITSSCTCVHEQCSCSVP
jgi:hypothetical protein